MADPIPDEVVRAAAQAILREAFCKLEHYMPDAQDRIVAATRAVLQAVADHAEDGIREAVDALARRAVEEEV